MQPRPGEKVLSSRVTNFLHSDLLDLGDCIRHMWYRSWLIPTLDHHTFGELLLLDRLG